MVPVNDVRLLKFVWCVPVQNLGEWVASKPDEVWSLLLRNRADGGLLPPLKRRLDVVDVGRRVHAPSRFPCGGSGP